MQTGANTDPENLLEAAFKRIMLNDRGLHNADPVFQKQLGK